MVDPQYSVLFVDDDLEVRTALAEYFSGAGWRARHSASAADALQRIEQDPPDIVVSDMRMPAMSGLELHSELQRRGVDLPFIIISAHGDIPMAVQATQAGVADFVEKPFDPEAILNKAERAVRDARLLQQNQRLHAQLGRLAGLDAILVGESPAMVELRRSITEIAEIDAAVLILGETGTGKELVARAIHDMSPRAGNEFVPINCAAVPEGLFESAMFGHVKGAFTNAVSASKGAFLNADRGSLFLDEIGSCPIDQQAKLLRVIESSEVTAVGSSELTPIDTRIVSATNADVRARIADGSFREDLFYRLSTITLELPPLRMRGQDVVLLFTLQLDRFAATYSTEAPELDADDMAVLLGHEWPGNVRELRQVAERRILSHRRGLGSVRESIDFKAAMAVETSSLRQQVELYERRLIEAALLQVDGNMDAVAAYLGIARRTLNEKLVKYGLNR